jgi:hypothetical protein
MVTIALSTSSSRRNGAARKNRSSIRLHLGERTSHQFARLRAATARARCEHTHLGDRRGTALWTARAVRTGRIAYATNTAPTRCLLEILHAAVRCRKCRELCGPGTWTVGVAARPPTRSRTRDGDRSAADRTRSKTLSVRTVVKLCGYARPVAARAGRHDTAI